MCGEAPARWIGRCSTPASARKGPQQPAEPNSKPHVAGRGFGEGQAKDAEVARLLVGTNNPSAASRPFAVAFTPDGTTLLVGNFRANNLSFVDVGKARAGEFGAEVARLTLATPGGAPARPRGIVVTPDGKYAAVTGAPRGASGSGVLWVVDLAARTTIARVTDVGNETYLLALVPSP